MDAQARDVQDTDAARRIDPQLPAAEHGGLAAVEEEQREKPDCLVEVFDDKADVDEASDAGAMGVH